MIYLVEYNDQYYLAENVRGVPTSVYAANMYDVGLVLHTGKYVLKRQLKVLKQLDTDSMQEAKKQYPEVVL